MLDSVTVRPILPDELEKVSYVRATSFGGDEAEVVAAGGDDELRGRRIAGSLEGSDGNDWVAGGCDDQRRHGDS